MLLDFTVATPAIPSTGIATRIATRTLRPTDWAAIRRAMRNASLGLPVLFSGRVERAGFTPVFR